ncbi:MAG: TIGR00730 family Rossman fold protein [Xanthobacteraceae bacterium]|nr:TIGR00730 family Rossman fold protein [Xanthobacteraceae bacterium]MBX3524173.1 TIGR00730 family Rossman fold protein [Xanthobacteraceae bacterium]MBX3534773.1 TIGR00730 family Rossman fold protein [Xanthobacteraceae bacterium]MBX3549980.1 TIGR00730 family Rossman fold protein [Xanthobacteraceae bacterium]MCW5674232.1 TIGR00730 family Rossman fold protein [Xanthobacteraceae bacterium]
MAEIKTICVFCGSSPGRSGKFIDDAKAFGTLLGKEKIHLVFGGGGVGLMGTVARAARDSGSEVTGIIPRFLVNRERPEAAHSTNTIVTEDMHERKHKMFEMADAFVALPGGIGTLEELIEQLTWIQLGQHQKPLLILNTEGFWNPLLKLLENFRDMGFVGQHAIDNLLVADKVEDILPTLTNAAKPVSLWALREDQAVSENM